MNLEIYWGALTMVRVAFAVAFVALAGCGGPRLAPVSGKVTLAGKPLPNAVVTFEPISNEPNPGPMSAAKTNAEGVFELQLATAPTKGAVVGKHKVSITAYEGDDSVVPSSGSDMKAAFRKAIVANEFNVESKLTFDVPSDGTKEANFDVTPKK